MGTKAIVVTGTYRHKETGRVYLAEGTIFNATNGEEGQVMVLYAGAIGTRFAREVVEFLQKFELVTG